MNRLGELLDNIMAEAQNVVEGVRDTDNNVLIYDILQKNLKKWKDDILKLINSDNVYNKPDTKRKDSKPDSKPDTKKKDSRPDNKQILKRKIVNQILRRKIVNQILRRKIVNQILKRRKIVNQILKRRKIVNRINEKTILKIWSVIGVNMRYKILLNIGKF